MPGSTQSKVDGSPGPDGSGGGGVGGGDREGDSGWWGTGVDSSP